MKVLVLGGGVFVGRHIVAEAVRRGHEVTTFTRGRNGSGISDSAEHVIGDRRYDLGRLAGRNWDVVIDTCGYRPSDVERSVRALRDQVGLYVFISSASAYPDHSIAGLDESADVTPTWSQSASPRNPAQYGPLKAACEFVVQKTFASRSVIIRPGLIVGPHDDSERFGYWLLRMKAGGNVLAPAPARAPIQFIDVRDHAIFVIHLAEKSIAGTFNVTSPEGTMTMRDLLDSCPAPLGTRVAWVAPELLDKFRVRPWTELPLWTGTDPGRRNTMRICVQRALKAGLAWRPVAATIADTLAWELARPLEFPRRGQLKTLKERLLLSIAKDEGLLRDHEGRAQAWNQP